MSSETRKRSSDEFMASFRELIDTVVNDYAETAEKPSELGLRVGAYLGGDARHLPVVNEDVPVYRAADLDIALAELRSRDPDSLLIGVSGGHARQYESFSGMVSHQRGVKFGVSAVDYENVAVGPDEDRRAVAFGVHLFRFEERPVAVLQRNADREYGRERGRIEVMSADQELAGRLLATVHALMNERSVLRGAVVSFNATDFASNAGGIRFNRRPELSPDDLVLPADTLARLHRHVVGIGVHRELLRRAGQHLKRGILLHGPPGSGKTLTVRYLLARTPGVTAVLLTGVALKYIADATALARAMQPALVVLEDADLVAEDRDNVNSPQPLLFEVLESLDGLEGDADVTFVLTTNRVNLLERALTERPGRVDLAVEIGLPDLPGRLALLKLYARDLPFSDAAIDSAAERSDGLTASFFKELVRRAVLSAADAGRPVRDADLASALDELLSDRDAVTRSLLGAANPSDAATSVNDVSDSSVRGGRRGVWIGSGCDCPPIG